MAKSKSMPKNKSKSKSKSMPKNSISAKTRKAAISRSKRADLIFPVGRITRFLRKGKHSKLLGGTAPVYLAGVLEYLVAEIMELSGYAAKANRRGRISPRDINLAILQDDEFSRLLNNVTISRGGVLPNILEVLKPIRPLK